MSRVPSPIPSHESLAKLLAYILCFALLLSTTPLVLANEGKAGKWNLLRLFSQDHRNVSRPGAPEGIFPNMDEMRAVTDDARRNGARVPNIPTPIPSTRRRWRSVLATPGTVMQSPQDTNGEFRNLLAFSSAPSKILGNPWLSSESQAPLSDSPFTLFSASRSAPAGAPLPQGSPNFAMARLAPQNRTGTLGVDLLSGNFNWNLRLIGLHGRSGLDLGLGLSYNSKVWTASGNYINFGLDQGTPAPGFRLGFPVVQGLYYNDLASTYFYMLITPAGQRIELRRLGTTNVYQTVDATYAQLTDNGSYLIFKADGAQLTLVPSGGEYLCTAVKDRNGNYLTIAYNASGDITTVTDTLARVINFNYDGYANLLSITQTWGRPDSHLGDLWLLADSYRKQFSRAHVVRSN